MYDDFYNIRAIYKPIQPIQSEITKEGKQINCVDYMRKFILAELKLNEEEIKILNEIRHYGIENMINKQLKLLNKRRCKICNEIKPLSDFYNHFATCKECYNAGRKKRKKVGNNDRC